MNKMKRLLALLLAVLMLTSVMLGTLASCEKAEDDSSDNGDQNGSGAGTNGGGNNSGGNGSGDQGGNQGTTNPPGIIDYKISIKTEGGMAMSSLPVYLYTLVDGELDELVDYGNTDENGSATFKLKSDEVTGYALWIKDSLPKGYVCNDYYPLVGTSLDVNVSSALITDDTVGGKNMKLGDIMYDFTVVNTEGKQVKLSEELAKNDVVVLNFWYVNCSACQLEFPYMKTVYEEEAYNDKVSIIALNPIDDDLSIRTFANENGFTFNVAQDTAGVALAFGIENYPTSVVIDRYGMVSLIEVGALPSARGFRVMFDHFIGNSYVQSKVASLNDITPVEVPNIPMPAPEDISNAFDGGALADKNADYYMDPNETMAWAFVIDEFDGKTCLKATNSGKEDSFAQLYVKLDLEAGDVVAFDYFASSELGADILYVLVDGKDIYRISGIGTAWQTCYAYVAEEAGTYEIAFCYIKDGDDSTLTDEDKALHQDNVFLKNLRIVSEEEIDAPSYIFRYASNNPDDYGIYTEYVTVVLGSDGYYHVGSANGPLLLADLMGRTHFSDTYDIYTLSINMDIEDQLVRYCNYASNSQLHGLCPVTEELKALLEQVVDTHYAGDPTENTWLDICCYYDAYGTEDQLADPIKGLAHFSAYDVILSENGDTDFPNKVVYDRVIMPRGLFFAFTPTVSGVYQVTSSSDYEVNAWIFRKNDIDLRNEWVVYDNVARLNGDSTNCYMIAYLEARTTYYIDIAYYDVYQFGTINFRLQRLGDAGIYRFSLASPGYFTYYENTDSSTINKIVSGGIEVELGEDGIWREKRNDGRDGSILYADFTAPTPIFSKSIMDMIDAKAFDFRMTENDLFVINMKSSNNAYNFYLDLKLQELWGDEYEANCELYKVNEVLKGIYHGEVVGDVATKSENDQFILDLLADVKTNTVYNNDENFRKFLRYYWTEEFADEYFELYQVDEVLAGEYHGTGSDYTDFIREYAQTHVIKAGYNEILGVEIAEDDERIGCVVATEELTTVLQMLMDKYTFANVEFSWAKLCYYHEYFGPEAE